jgi:hypothetical protein
MHDVDVTVLGVCGSLQVASCVVVARVSQGLAVQAKLQRNGRVFDLQCVYVHVCMHPNVYACAYVL